MLSGKLRPGDLANDSAPISISRFSRSGFVTVNAEVAKRPNPLEIVERFATSNNVAFERNGDDEIDLLVRGKWTDYQVSFTWIDSLEVLHLACAFDMKIPDPRLSEVQRLVACINEQLWLGHFDIWMQNGTVVFRHSLLLVGGVAASVRQCEVMLGSALDAAERYYPAFQFVVWSGQTARDAMDAVMLETAGEG
jgi:hypothetical protein